MGTNRSFSQPACLSQCLVGYVSSLEGNTDIKKAGFAYDAWKEQIHSPKWWFNIGRIVMPGLMTGILIQSWLLNLAPH